MRRWLKWLLLIPASGILVFLYFIFPPSFYFPHERPILILPIESKYDSRANIMPMGEKIAHPDAPLGHPGIDFGFGGIKESEFIPYIAAMDGVITKVKIYPNDEKKEGEIQAISKNMADVIIKKGPYQTAYTSLDGDTLPKSIKVGVKIKQGDFVGYGNFMYKGTEPGTKSEMIHWEFGSTSPLIDRFCPLEYFTDESRERIEKIWAQTQDTQIKPQYPLICNGGYEGKVER